MENKTKICCLDVNKDIIDFLLSDFDIYNGSMGKKVTIPKVRQEAHFLLNYDFPSNLHEYDISIEDMHKPQTVDYKKEEHTRGTVIEQKAYYFISYLPDTIFDPIPYGCSIFNNFLQEKKDKPMLKILFQSAKYNIGYILKNIATYDDSSHSEQSNHSHIRDFSSKSMHGKKVCLCENKISKILYEPFLNDITYIQTYDIPTRWSQEQQKHIDDEKFLPLLKNQNGDVVSYLWYSENDITFMFPQMKNKVAFLENFFNEVLYRYFSEYFPFVKANAWVENKEYFLPGHENFLNSKEENERKHEEAVRLINEQIIQNKENYSFLHKILTETGDELVSAVITYLKWLGFENAIAKDETSENGLLEEDVQIDLGNDGLLIIEVKGIGGTSKDAECSQIHKIKFRRSEERGKFDVHALYLVNNERHLAPLKRTIPPFNATQIKDAVHDKRGLLCTWQLFNLFFNIENGFITKENARKRLLLHGLIDFTPDLVELGKPYKYFDNNKIVCIEINHVNVSVGDFLLYEIEERFYRQKIVALQQEKQSVNNATQGKTGFELENPIPNIKKAYFVKHG